MKGIAMPEFMILAILLLTLVASCAIRRAEEDMIHRNELDRHARKTSPPAASGGEMTSGTKVRA